MLGVSIAVSPGNPVLAPSGAGGGGGEIPTLPSGFAFVVDNSSNYVVDDGGNYVISEIV